MNKSISTLILLGVSVLVVLYILSAFHKVFNRETIHDQTASASVEGEVQTDTVRAAAQSMANLNEQITTSAATATDEQSENDSAIDNAIAAVDTESTEAPATGTSETSTSETSTQDVAVETVGNPGEVLRERPHLQNALPPIPQAPPRPEGSPIVTAPSTESFSQTNNSSGSFPTPVTSTDSLSRNPTSTSSSGSSAFPSPFTSPAPNTNSPAPSSNTQSSSSFPIPH